MLHLSLGCTISGTGHITGTSNIFFLIDKKDHDFIPILTFKGDSSYGRSGWCCYGYDQTYIFLADFNRDGVKEILTREYKFEIDRQEHKRENSLSTELDVYKYDIKDKKFKLTGHTTNLPSDALELDRVYSIAPHEDSDEDWQE